MSLKYHLDLQINYLLYFDNQNHIWIWGWLLTELNANQTLLSRELLNYGLKLAYSKLPKLSASEELIKPVYPLSVTATGMFYDLGPPPSNSTI